MHVAGVGDGVSSLLGLTNPNAETPIPRTKVFSSWVPKRRRQVVDRHIRGKPRSIELPLCGSDVGFDLCSGGFDFRPHGFDFGFCGFDFRHIFYGGFDFDPVLNIYY